VVCSGCPSVRLSGGRRNSDTNAPASFRRRLAQATSISAPAGVRERADARSSGLYDCDLRQKQRNNFTTQSAACLFRALLSATNNTLSIQYFRGVHMILNLLLWTHPRRVRMSVFRRLLLSTPRPRLAALLQPRVGSWSRQICFVRSTSV
jgi:hypothetical protein